MQLDPNPAAICGTCHRPKSVHRCGAQHRTVVVQCPTCKELFPTIPSELARGSGIYCGRKCYGEAKRAEALARFDSRLIETASGCREWPGPRLSNGYGHTTSGNRGHLTHRLAWELAHGPIPPGMNVCHKCDNPPCCNVEHLFLGKALDNVNDKIAKGHQPRGEDIRQARLTADDVRHIRSALASGIARGSLARNYAVAVQTIGCIARYETWRHIT